MKALKIVGIAGAVIVLLVALGVAVIVARFDAQQAKTEIARVVKDSKQRDLRIEGEVGLSLWPDIGLRLGRTILSERKSTDTFAGVESARIAVAVLPLITQGRIEIKEVDLQGVQATIIRNRDGSLNIDDLLGKKNNETTALQINLPQGLAMRNAQLTWRDEQTRQIFGLNGLSLSTGRTTLDTGTGHYAVERLKLSTRLALHSQANQPMEITRFEGAIGDLQVNAQTLAATVKDINLESEGQIGNKATGGKTFNVVLQSPELQFNPAGKSKGELRISAHGSGEGKTLATKLFLGAIEGDDKALKIGAIDWEFDASADGGSLKGTLKSALQADLDKHTVGLEALNGSMVLAHPQMPMKQLQMPLQGHLRANWAAQTASGRLQTQFDETKIQAGFDLTRFSPWALGFDLAMDQLDVDHYFPPRTDKAEQPGAASKEEASIDWSGLQGLNLRGTVQIGRLKVAQLVFNQIHMQIKAANGQLDIAPHRAQLYKGSLTGALAVNAQANTVSMRETLTGIDINPLLVDLAGKDMLEGRGQLILDLNTRGKQVSALKKALTGTASLRLTDGAVKGINLAAQFRDIKAKITGGSNATHADNKAEKTDFSELSASFKIENGIAHNQDLSMKSPLLRLAGQGDIDIGAGTLNYLSKISLVATAKGQGGREAGEVKGVTIPLRLTGPLNGPTWQIEYAAMVSEMARAQVQEKIDEQKEKLKAKVRNEVNTKVQNKIQNQVQDKLKGLFGR
jgi:AsmA protein